MRKGPVLAASAFLCWAFLSPGNEVLLKHMGPLWMQASRLVLATIAVTLWLGPGTMLAATRLLARPRIAMALFLGTFASFALFSYAQTRIDAASTTLGFFASPLWTAIVAWWLLGERPRPSFLPAVLVLLAGGGLALGVGTMAPDAVGIALAVGSGITWAFYATLLRRDASEVPWKDLLGASIVIATPLFLAIALVGEEMPRWQDLPMEAWIWTLVQVVVPTIIAVALFQAALRHSAAATVNLFVGLELAGAVFLSWLILGTTFTPWQLLGVALVLAAVTGYLLDAGRRAVTS